MRRWRRALFENLDLPLALAVAKEATARCCATSPAYSDCTTSNAGGDRTRRGPGD